MSRFPPMSWSVKTTRRRGSWRQATGCGCAASGAVRARLLSLHPKRRPRTPGRTKTARWSPTASTPSSSAPRGLWPRNCGNSRKRPARTNSPSPPSRTTTPTACAPTNSSPRNGISLRDPDAPHVGLESGVEGELRVGAVEVVVAEFAAFVGDRVVQRVRADVAPEPVEAVGVARRAGAGDFEDRRGDVEGDVGGDDLQRGDLFGQFASFGPGQGRATGVGSGQVAGDAVGQRRSAAEPGGEVAVGGEHVRILSRGRGIAQYPRPAGGAGVLACRGERAFGDAEVEVPEHGLDRGSDEGTPRGRLLRRERADHVLRSNMD